MEKPASSNEDVLTYHETKSPFSEMTSETSLALDMGTGMSINSCLIEQSDAAAQLHNTLARDVDQSSNITETVQTE